MLCLCDASSATKASPHSKIFEYFCGPQIVGAGLNLFRNQKLLDVLSFVADDDLWSRLIPPLRCRHVGPVFFSASLPSAGWPDQIGDPVPAGRAAHRIEEFSDGR